MKPRRIIVYALLGLVLGAAGGFSLMPLRDRDVLKLGFTSIVHLAVLGLLLAAPGPAVELGVRGVWRWFTRRAKRLFEIVTMRHKPRMPVVTAERKLSAALFAGAVGMNVLVLAVLYLVPLVNAPRVEVFLFAMIFALFPTMLALVDCFMDHLMRAIWYEALCAAIGGLAGLGLAWPVVMASGMSRLLWGLAGALYGFSVWCAVGISKLVEEVEEEIEAAEEEQDPT